MALAGHCCGVSPSFGAKLRSYRLRLHPLVVPWNLLQRSFAESGKILEDELQCSHQRAVLTVTLKLNSRFGKDRGEWTHRFSTRPSASLEAILKEAMVEREAAWVASTRSFSGAPNPTFGCSPSGCRSPACQCSSVAKGESTSTALFVQTSSGSSVPSRPTSFCGRQVVELKGGRIMCGSYQPAGHKCNARIRESQIGQLQGAGVSAPQSPQLDAPAQEPPDLTRTRSFQEQVGRLKLKEEKRRHGESSPWSEPPKTPPSRLRKVDKRVTPRYHQWLDGRHGIFKTVRWMRSDIKLATMVNGFGYLLGVLFNSFAFLKP